jgi:hypothetical protein
MLRATFAAQMLKRTYYSPSGKTQTTDGKYKKLEMALIVMCFALDNFFTRTKKTVSTDERNTVTTPLYLFPFVNTDA